MLDLRPCVGGQLDGTDLGFAGAGEVAFAGDGAEVEVVSGVGRFVGAVGDDAVTPAGAAAAAGEVLHFVIFGAAWGDLLIVSR